MNPGAVFDCMVYLQGAAREESPAAACFRLVEEGRLTLCLSPQILAEVKDVLSRPGLRRKFPPLTPQWVKTFVENAERKAMMVTDVPHACSCPRDPDDEPYVDLAIATGATYLVSRDKDLLDLMHEPAFRTRFPNLTMTPWLSCKRCDNVSEPPSRESTPSRNHPLQPANSGGCDRIDNPNGCLSPFSFTA
jgi:putative PIN family toxin of toxin-antitoxin system